MMKKILFFVTIVLGVNVLNAQVKVKTTKLDNGLKVVMCEEHSSPKVYGAVYVHVGSKNDPVDATGMAHYFEHIMFKGTDSIGTINWEAEKVYLDSIDIMYDKLHETSDVKEREAIQHKINQLSIASAEYAIPNETDLILTRMGGDKINAVTSYDHTIYYNNFPSNQIGKWMDVYVERFRNPVFRLFQNELETVYEEKNKSSDEFDRAIRDYMYGEVFGEHPYSTPIIGLTEHLKNPQPRRMREFFNTYYVANNMTLILVGDFKIEDIEPMVAEKFGKWRSGELPKEPTYTLPEFHGPTIKNVRKTPVKSGIMVWRGVKISDPDNVPLDLACDVFLNGETGIMDKDVNDGKLIMASLDNYAFEDHGVNVIIYVPKLIGQSHEKAEELVLTNIEKLKSGDFSDDLFEAIRMKELKERTKTLENFSKLSHLFITLEDKDMSYEDYLAETERVRTITKEEVVAIANKYFTNDYLDVRSRIGFPAKDKIEKPNWKPLQAKNSEAKSEFAKMIEAEKVPEVKPQVIEFGKDVEISEANDCFTMFSTKNPYNDIFNLTINYNYGTIKDPDLKRAIYYLDLQGSEHMSLEEIGLELQKLGASFYINSKLSYTSLTITGFEKDFDKILDLCEQKYFHPSNDETKIDYIVNDEKMMDESLGNDAKIWIDALYESVIYGNNSTYLSKTSLEKWKKRSGEELLGEAKNVFNFNGNIYFSGNIDNQEVINSINKHGLIKNDATIAEKRIIKDVKLTKDQVFISSNKKLRQSAIYMYVPGSYLSEEEKAVSLVFNKYFGTDMYSIVFQEIREFRSLGYIALGQFNQDYLNRKPGYLITYLGTQGDKTVDATTSMRNLITEMPERMEKFEVSKDALIMARASDYISFRDMPQSVSSWVEQGYDHDPRAEVTDIIRKTEYKDVYNFYKKFVADRPIIIMISGNKKQFDLKALEKFGEIKELKHKDLFN